MLFFCTLDNVFFHIAPYLLITIRIVFWSFSLLKSIQKREGKLIAIASKSKKERQLERERAQSRKEAKCLYQKAEKIKSNRFTSGYKGKSNIHNNISQYNKMIKYFVFVCTDIIFADTIGGITNNLNLSLV